MHVKQCNRDGIRTRNLQIRSPTPYPLGHTIIQQADNTTATIATSNFLLVYGIIVLLIILRQMLHSRTILCQS